MQMSRRLLLSGALLLPAASIAGCGTMSGGGGVTFSVVQGYVATIQSFVDKITPIIISLDPTKTAEITSIKQQVDAAAAAFEELPANTATAKTTAQTIYQLTGAAIQIAEALPIPSDAKAILTAVQLLLIVIGSFFGFAPVPSAGPPRASLVEARSRYDQSSDKTAAAADADRQVKAWVSTPRSAPISGS